MGRPALEEVQGDTPGCGGGTAKTPPTPTPGRNSTGVKEAK